MFIRAGKLRAFFNHITAASWAFLGNRTSPAHEIALRIINTSVVATSLLRHLDHDILTALRACNADLLVIRLRIAAVRESRAC